MSEVLKVYPCNIWLQVYRGISIEVTKAVRPAKVKYHIPLKDVLQYQLKSINKVEIIWYYHLTMLEEIFKNNDFEKLWLEPDDIDENGGVYYMYHIEPFNKLEFHGNISFYEKRQNLDMNKRALKIGCDYDHLNDMGRIYDEKIVWKDACNSVDILHKLFHLEVY